MTKPLTDGDYHDALTRKLTPFCAAACGVLAVWFGWEVWAVGAAVLVGAAGCLFGLWCNPDLDQKGLSNAETKFIKAGVLGVSIMGAWIMFWGVYTKLIPRHRHWSSHAPLIGTLGRLAYIAVLPVLALVAAGQAETALSFSWAWPYVVMFSGSLAVADCGHWWRDVTESAKKGIR